MKAVIIIAPSVVKSLLLAAGLLMLCYASARASGDDALAAHLRQLPASVGSNHTITVPRGESWVAVGESEHVGYLQLLRANPTGFHPGALFIPGRHIVETPVPAGIVINIPELTLFYLEDGHAQHWYPVSVGMVGEQWHTITGNFSVGRKEVNPNWRKPLFAGGGTMPPGPHNPLGDRLLDLSIPYYGLHGTNDPPCIGRYVSHGCIRMFPPFMHQLFDLVDVGTPLTITYDTIKVGQEHGIVYLAIFPDVYGKGVNTPEQLRARLAQYGLSDALSEQDVQHVLARPDGVARPILGSSLPVTVNGTPWQNPIGPTRRDGVLYLPLNDLVATIGAQTNWDKSGGQASVTYQGKTATFPVDGHTAFNALDSVFIAVHSFTAAFGGTTEVSGGRLRLTTK
jgi:L,D-transpeptidase ErfK/SrfK